MSAMQPRSPTVEVLDSMRRSTARWTVGLTGRTAYYLLDQHYWVSEGHLVQSFAVDRNNSLRMDLSLNETGDETSVQFLLGWHHYFRL